MLWRRQVIVRTPVGALQIITPLIARHNVYNILAAVAVGLAVTVDGEPIPLKVLTLGPSPCAVQGLTGKMTAESLAGACTARPRWRAACQQCRRGPWHGVCMADPFLSGRL